MFGQSQLLTEHLCEKPDAVATEVSLWDQSTTVALCAGYFTASILAFCRSLGRRRWWQLGPRVLMPAASFAVYLVSIHFAWRICAPVLRGYGMDNQTGSMAVVFI